MQLLLMMMIVPGGYNATFQTVDDDSGDNGDDGDF